MFYYWLIMLFIKSFTVFLFADDLLDVLAGGITAKNFSINFLLYANDIGLISDSPSGL